MSYRFTARVFLHSQLVRFQIVFCGYVIRVNRDKSPDDLQKDRKFTLRNKFDHLQQLIFYTHNNPPL